MAPRIVLLHAFAWTAAAAVFEEAFDREPDGWEGVNHRTQHFAPRTVAHDFGHSLTTSHAGGQPGEIGGRIYQAGEAAYYGYRLPSPLDLDTPLSARGRIWVRPGAGHFLVGFFNATTLNEWRTPNTLAARINGRGETFHCHLEYCTARWRAGAGVIGQMVPGERVNAKPIVAGRVHDWEMVYDPASAQGRGALTLRLDGDVARCELAAEHRADGARFTHFGLLPVLKTWDSPGEVWLDDLTINGADFDFSTDPGWDGLANRRTYVTPDTRPRFDFGWSPTHYAGGRRPGELGGLIFRGDCREPARLAAYGARLASLTLDGPLVARGRVAMLRGVTDSTASIGFYHSQFSLQSSPAQDQSIPMDYLGINIEGPSSEGFFFYPVYRLHGGASRALGGGSSRAPRIYPDRRPRDWFLEYDPDAAGGSGCITVGLDGETCRLELEPGHKRIGASFDRFGICTPWIDGNSVTVYFDDLVYTGAPGPEAGRP